jgi:Rrf2 family iron-sulfur cluster assembly transcriptional regulator
MILTRKGDYGVRALMYLAKQPPGKLSSIKEISEAMEIPQVFLAKVMKQFVRRGMVTSKRGIAGGYMLGRPPSALTLREIVEAMEGPITMNNCLKKKSPCHRKKECDAAPVWEAIQQNFIRDLERYTIAKIIEGT